MAVHDSNLFTIKVLGVWIKNIIKVYVKLKAIKEFLHADIANIINKQVNWLQ